MNVANTASNISSSNALSNGNNAASGSSNQSQQLQQTSNKLDEVLAQSKDAQTMISILRDMGVDEYEPRVVNQLLEFSYRYITNLLEDAKAFSSHANKKTIDSEDIKMAIKSKVDYSFTTTPPRDLLMEISKSKNKNPLPPIKYHTGIRLPPDRFCLHSQNYSLKTQVTQQTQEELSEQMYQSRLTYNQQHQQSASKLNQSNRNTDTATFMSSTSLTSAKRQRTDDEDYDI